MNSQSAFDSFLGGGDETLDRLIMTYKSDLNGSRFLSGLLEHIQKIEECAYSADYEEYITLSFLVLERLLKFNHSDVWLRDSIRKSEIEVRSLLSIALEHQMFSLASRLRVASC